MTTATIYCTRSICLIVSPFQTKFAKFCSLLKHVPVNFERKRSLQLFVSLPFNLWCQEASFLTQQVLEHYTKCNPSKPKCWPNKLKETCTYPHAQGAPPLPPPPSITVPLRAERKVINKEIIVATKNFGFFMSILTTDISFQTTEVTFWLLLMGNQA